MISCDSQNTITQYQFNPDDFYPIFRSAFNSAYKKFATHILQHPTRSLFHSSQIFDPLYLKIGIHTGDTSHGDIRQYSAITKLSNPSDEFGFLST
ncbi:hypothetical protein Glove_103g305 [Diversispora epigaea]|uniref:Uncharacterized protein n=1 Tax=Diversispora epigaea TaxID=1348612 RepID=A0A397JA63_9GLOM|nr:hypothetical protein Glove_103g305 [Diversispora epigaea]